MLTSVSFPFLFYPQYNRTAGESMMMLELEVRNGETTGDGNLMFKGDDDADDD